jgi:C4-dicarboxylate-specific signal transduction histidine kinase
LRFLSNEWKDRCRSTELEPHQTIWANKNKLIQVITNLLAELARRAWKKDVRQREKPTIRIEGRVENGRSIVSVRDNGPASTRASGQDFDPFFTTKDVGEGMGWAEHCYRIVQECEGGSR